MTPAELQPGHFEPYPPQARQLASAHITSLRRLPIGFLPLLLREVIAYDYKFPVERKELDDQFTYLEGMTAPQLQQVMRSFSELRITPDLERLDWVNGPVEFSERLSAHLWATHQIDRFRAAAVEYVAKLNAARRAQPLPAHRAGIVIIGQGVEGSDYALFRKLRPYGVHYKAVSSANAITTIVNAVNGRAARYSAPFAHWFLDGSHASPAAAESVTCISYGSLTSLRALLQARIQNAYESAMGSEALRTMLAKMRPADVGLEDSVLNHFQLSLLTEGSGTQIFSTTFVQWAAREVWRRAQPLTLLTHFTPRQRESSSRQMLSEARGKPPLDPEGSLVDADMGAYYTWINQQRLAGAADARFLVWFEGHNQALAIAPGLHKGTESAEPIEIGTLVANTLSA